MLLLESVIPKLNPSGCILFYSNKTGLHVTVVVPDLIPVELHLNNKCKLQLHIQFQLLYC